ncbi:MAG: MotA/TolQ/ExbB proton channel family protein [Candidatus Marinamargulisbacteria bacterium]
MSVIVAGGWVLWGILFLSVFAMAIAFQKLWLLRTSVVSHGFLSSVKTQLQTDTKDDVIKKLQYSRRLEGQLAALAIQKYNDSDAQVRIDIDTIVKSDIKKLTDKMGLLAVIITVAPVLGLLGTVLGLMDVFAVLAVEGVTRSQELSVGISKALITTVAGLSLAIPLMFIHHYLSGRIEARLDDWDAIPTQLMAHLRG